MQEYINVEVIPNGSKATITREHYEKYQGDYVYLGVYMPPETVDPLVGVPVRELKDLLDVEGIKYKGNASRKTLIKLLED